jgi:hypothetical protein
LRWLGLLFGRRLLRHCEQAQCQRAAEGQGAESRGGGKSHNKSIVGHEETFDRHFSRISAGRSVVKGIGFLFGSRRSAMARQASGNAITASARGSGRAMDARRPL